jgi:hypothetical protein
MMNYIYYLINVITAPLPCAHCPSALCSLPLCPVLTALCSLHLCPLPLSPVLTASLPLCPLPLSAVLTAPLPTASQSCAHCPVLTASLHTAWYVQVRLCPAAPAAIRCRPSLDVQRDRGRRICVTQVRLRRLYDSAEPLTVQGSHATPRAPLQGSQGGNPHVFIGYSSILFDMLLSDFATITT